MKAMKIKMKRSCEYSRNVRDIDFIYLDSIHAYWTKAQVHDYLKENPNVAIDYIHGTEEVERLCRDENAVGFIFDGMEKSELFSAVDQDGSLPRKTFSMGHADDKRFYIEGRRIK